MLSKSTNHDTKKTSLTSFWYSIYCFWARATQNTVLKRIMLDNKSLIWHYSVWFRCSLYIFARHLYFDSPCGLAKILLSLAKVVRSMYFSVSTDNFTSPLYSEFLADSSKYVKTRKDIRFYTLNNDVHPNFTPRKLWNDKEIEVLSALYQFLWLAFLCQYKNETGNFKKNYSILILRLVLYCTLNETKAMYAK